MRTIDELITGERVMRHVLKCGYCGSLHFEPMPRHAPLCMQVSHVICRKCGIGSYKDRLELFVLYDRTIEKDMIVYEND